MKLILISSPTGIENEAGLINSFFDKGLQFFHLRKPGMSEEDMKMLLLQIRKEYYDRIVLHSPFSFVEKFRLKGYHFNRDSYNQVNGPAILKNRHKSFSFHSFPEVEENKIEYDYAFLSPVFNSISKSNYKSCFDPEELREFLKNKKNIIALGGVDEDKLMQVKELGFSGAAVLGAVWNAKDPVQKFNQLKTVFNNLQEVTLNVSPYGWSPVG